MVEVVVGRVEEEELEGMREGDVLSVSEGLVMCVRG